MGKKTDTAMSLIPSASYTLVQSAMLFCHYGLDYKMPWWVVWFPTVVLALVLAVVGIVALLIIVVQAIID